MADVTDYTSGKILTNIKLTLYSLKLVKIPVLGPLVRTELFKRIKNFEPKIIDINAASTLIQESEVCAVGERVCRAINHDFNSQNPYF